MSTALENPGKKNYAVKYLDKLIIVKPIPDTLFTINLPSYYALLVTGEQIINHLNPKFNDKYFSWVKENYKIPNYAILEN